MAGVGWKEGVVGHTTLAIDSASPPGRTIQTAGPVIIDDLPNDPEFRMAKVLREHGIVSLLNVPSMVDSATWRVLEVDSDKSRDFDESDNAFLTTAANVLGVVLLRYETERRACDQAFQHLQAHNRLEILLRELQHRVKNNLQTIISFLSFKRRLAESTETREKLGSVMDRVHAIALAHDQLAIGDKVGQVDLGDYFERCAPISILSETVSRLRWMSRRSFCCR